MLIILAIIVLSYVYLPTFFYFIFKIFFVKINKILNNIKKPKNNFISLNLYKSE